MKRLEYIRFLGYAAFAAALFLAPRPPHVIPVQLSGGSGVTDDDQWLEKEEKSHAEAIARLPVFDEQSMALVLKVLRAVKYPIPLDELRHRLGGPDSLVWCCTQLRGDKQTDTFSVFADAHAYELVVDYEDSGFKRTPSIVGRARLCYTSPFGWRFEAESMTDFLQVGVPEKASNQVPEPTAASSRGSS